jgi:predicted dehydrogenase
MTEKKIGVAIVGCGNIAGPYLRDLVTYPEIEITGVTDLDMERAEALAAPYGYHVFPSLDDLLADEETDLVVNLTIHRAHREITARCLEAGKHVHSEKPLALTPEEAWSLVELADQRGLRLGCSPFTWMGEAQQTAWKQIREGRLGTVRVAYAEVDWGRIETWHPNPAPFYEVGPLWDVGVYPLAMMTTVFGAARQVWSYGSVLWPERETKERVPFHVETPDFMVSVVEFGSGTLARLTTNFYVTQKRKRDQIEQGIEFHGDLGSLYLGSWHMFNAEVEFAEYDKPFEPVPHLREPHKGVPWGRSVLDMAEAITEGRPHRATGEQAAHIVEIICAAEESMRRNEPVSISSTFSPPAPMEWAL